MITSNTIKMNAPIPPNREHVGIIGAGITGICSALLLLREGFAVTLYSDEPALSTNSDAAVASWYAPSNSAPLLQAITSDYKRCVFPAYRIFQT